MKTQNYSKLAKELGKRGGDKTAERGPDYYREIGRKGAEKRWLKARELLLPCGHSSMTEILVIKDDGAEIHKCMICGRHSKINRGVAK